MECILISQSYLSSLHFKRQLLPPQKGAHEDQSSWFILTGLFFLLYVKHPLSLVNFLWWESCWVSVFGSIILSIPPNAHKTLNNSITNVHQELYNSITQRISHRLPMKSVINNLTSVSNTTCKMLKHGYLKQQEEKKMLPWCPFELWSKGENWSLIVEDSTLHLFVDFL